MVTGLRSVERSVQLIERAAGRRPPDDASLWAKLREARRVGELEQVLLEAQCTLDVLSVSTASRGSAKHQRKLDEALATVDRVIQQSGEAHPLLLAQTIRRQVVAAREGRPASPGCEDVCADDPAARSACWRVEAVEPVSRHSALFLLRSRDGARGKSSSRDSTWHVTLRADIGGDGDSGGDGGGGVEREYTPVSTCEEWAAGQARLLVKIYPEGRATQWLHGCSVGRPLWLSPPKTTLRLPTLTPAPAGLLHRRGWRAGAASSSAQAAVDFSSVLLLAGGTGIAPLWQLMRGAMCEDPSLCTLPLTLIYSCRADDLLMAQAIAQSVASRAAETRAIVTLTEPSSAGPPPHPQQAPPATATELSERFKPVSFAAGRVSEGMLRESLHPSPKVVVSGPATFIEGMGELLQRLGVPRRAVVSLRA